MVLSTDLGRRSLSTSWPFSFPLASGPSISLICRILNGSLPDSGWGSPQRLLLFWRGCRFRDVCVLGHAIPEIGLAVAAHLDRAGPLVGISDVGEAHTFPGDFWAWTRKRICRCANIRCHQQCDSATKCHLSQIIHPVLANLVAGKEDFQYVQPS